MREPALKIGDISQLPAIMKPKRYAKEFGRNPRWVQKACAEGRIPAVKVCGVWYIQTAKALKQLGIAADEGGE